jgi:superfamily I DNA/RNA helicase
VGVKNIEDIKLTPAQESCVKFADNKDLLIRGIAGSGKSLILIKKALKLAQQAKEENVNRKIAIFTFANTLVNYTQELMGVHPSLLDYITVATLDSELHKLYKNVFKDSRGKLEYNIVTEFLNEVVAKFKKKSNNRFLQKDKREFLADEIQWMKQRMINTYLICSKEIDGMVLWFLIQ